MRTLVKNATILTMNERMDKYNKGYLIVEGDTIKEVGSLSEMEENGFDQVIDGEEGILLPGMVNTHTHVGMIPFRSLGDDCIDRLRKILFPLETKYMTKELAYCSAKYAIAEMLLGGVTTFLDMYYFEEEIAKACQEMKARALLGETVVNFPSCDSDQPHGGLEYGEEFIRKWQNHPLITPIIAPHAPNTVDEKALIRVKEISDRYQIPFAIHLSEMDYEMEYFWNKYQLTPVEYLERIGVLGKRMVAAHCIHVTKSDLEILHKLQVKVAHCIGSNTKSAKGVAPVRKMLEIGLEVGLGTDGASSGNTLDLFTQLKLFANFHKNENKDRQAFPAAEIVKLATIGGARVLQLEDSIGSLEPGKKADFILVETKSVNMFPIYDPYAVLVYSANASNVDTVFVNGVPLVRNKTLQLFTLRDLRRDLEHTMAEFKNKALEIDEI